MRVCPNRGPRVAPRTLPRVVVLPSEQACLELIRQHRLSYFLLAGAGRRSVRGVAAFFHRAARCLPSILALTNLSVVFHGRFDSAGRCCARIADGDGTHGQDVGLPEL